MIRTSNVQKKEFINPLQGKKVIFIENPNEPKNADGAHGHLAAIGISEVKRSFYDRVWKRIVDIILSFLGLIVLSPVFLLISVAVFVDDPGPILFAQKRIGIKKKYFKLHKFRTMKMNTPHDVPTHMLSNPEQYITRVGKILRKLSLDELPQICDILFTGEMSIIGPRPALWNQDILVAEREKYNVNDIKPGLTGWAQINGRDELEIPAKAKLDGVYAEKLIKGGMAAFLFDCKCFFGTFINVLRGEGIVEGGTGMLQTNTIHPKNELVENNEDDNNSVDIK